MMVATFESIMDAALLLHPDERCRIATSLWESVGPPLPDSPPDENEHFLNQREAEMDTDPSVEISKEEFMAHFASRRPS